MSIKPVVYIAGPISKGDLVHNIGQADAAFKKLFQVGFAPINPMWSVFSGSVERSMTWNVIAFGTSTGGLGLKHAEWLGIDLPIVERCDAVLRLPGESRGADTETEHAVKHGVPVYDSIDALIADKAKLMRATHTVTDVVWGYTCDVGKTDFASCRDATLSWNWKVGDTVKFVNVDGGGVEVCVVEDVYEGLARLIPAAFLEKADDTATKTFEGFLSVWGTPAMKPDDCVRVFLTRRIA